jgi:phenylpropionate dioxygenase-like ring-hydroxylating dioxygenase large terminal subunit
MPQSPAIGALSSRYKIEVLPARTAYGCVWTTLGDPLLDIPELREPGDGWRLIPEFDEEWDTHPARLMENSFDPAHTVFVHAATFGDTQNPVVEPPRVSHTDYGFIASNDLSVRNSDTFISRSTGDVTVRHTATHFFAPFLRVMAATYPSGVTHAIHTAATPVDANRLRLVQWVLRNDTEKDAPAADLVAFDRRVTIEDKNLLESIWTPYSSSVNANVHMAADRAQIALRRLWTDIETGAWPVATATNLVTAQFGN